MKSRALVLALLLALALGSSPSWAAVAVDGAGDPGSSVSPDASRGTTSSGRAANPAVWWFVRVVVVKGGHHAAKELAYYSVKEAMEEDAEEAAKNQAFVEGYRVISVNPPIRGDFRTAGGFTIRWYEAPLRKNGFESFENFKEQWGSAGKNRDWHHIVEQKHRGVVAGRIPAYAVHNRQNLISIRRTLHQQCLSALMSRQLQNIPKAVLDAIDVKRVPANRAKKLRFVIGGHSFRNSHTIGLKLLGVCGVKVPPPS